MCICIRNPLFISTSSMPEKNTQNIFKGDRKKYKLLQHIIMYVLMGHMTTE